ncbi:MAG: bacillithiol biosynthesis deacetylase BshB1 [Acidobacteria bacterium]|nr:bacillithiol biosynthesis deacetylase BshB1 [Acidobacteriota bacterium]
MGPVDVLVFSPHPDDAEMGCGGTIAALIGEGRSVAVCYLTRGEMGTRGDAETRAAETREAMKILGVGAYVYADIPDAHVFNDAHNRETVVRMIRQFQPRLILAPYHLTLHPDHVQTTALVNDAAYLSGLLKIDTGQPRHRPARIMYYPLHPKFDPTLVVDISSTFKQKMDAIRAYRSQFHDPSRPDMPQTLLSAQDFLDRLEAQARHFGSLIGRSYGEGFRTDLPLPVGEARELLQIL